MTQNEFLKMAVGILYFISFFMCGRTSIDIKKNTNFLRWSIIALLCSILFWGLK